MNSRNQNIKEKFTKSKTIVYDISKRICKRLDNISL